MPTGKRANFSAVAAGTASAVGLVAAISSAVALALRPPCPPGYVRLIDLQPAWPVVASLVAAASLAIMVVSCRRGNHPARAILSLAAVVVAAILLFGAAHDIALYGGTAYDPNCWTF